jgi:hypothetical protein
MGMRPARIELHIEELVLDGFTPADGNGMVRAIEAGLSGLLAKQELPSMPARESMEMIEDRPSPDGADDLENIGALIARSIYNGMGLDFH